MEWISTSERLPPPGMVGPNMQCSLMVIVFDKNHGVTFAYYNHYMQEWVSDAVRSAINPTFWQPLPQPPQENS